MVDGTNAGTKAWGGGIREAASHWTIQVPSHPSSVVGEGVVSGPRWITSLRNRPLNPEISPPPLPHIFLCWFLFLGLNLCIIFERQLQPRLVEMVIDRGGGRMAGMNGGGGGGVVSERI